MAVDRSELDVFSYLDYREFCRDYYLQQKSRDPQFSFRRFAEHAQIAGSYLKHIIDGERNLSPEMSIRFAQAMGLSGREIDYFENLVRFNQASLLEEKALYFERLRSRRARRLKSFGMAEAANLLAHWYVVAIKELVVSLNTDDPKIIQRALRRRLADTIISRTIESLVHLGWLNQDNGRWTSKAAQIQFPDEVRSYVVQSFHRQILDLASEAVEDDLERREFRSAIFSFPESKLPDLKQRLKELHQEMISYVQDLSREAPESETRAIYAIGLQCFSVSTDLKEVRHE